MEKGEKSFQIAIWSAVIADLASNAAPAGASGGAGAALPARANVVLVPEPRPLTVTAQVCGPPQFQRISIRPELSATRREKTPFSSGAENSTVSPGENPETMPSGRTMASHTNGFSKSSTCNGCWADATGVRATMPLIAQAISSRSRGAMAFIDSKSSWRCDLSGGTCRYVRFFTSARMLSQTWGQTWGRDGSEVQKVVNPFGSTTQSNFGGDGLRNMTCMFSTRQRSRNGCGSWIRDLWHRLSTSSFPLSRMLNP